MNIGILKKKLHKTIDGIEDGHLLEAVFTILTAKSSQHEYDLGDEEIKIIQERKSAYKAGKENIYTRQEVRESILANLAK